MSGIVKLSAYGAEWSIKDPGGYVGATLKQGRPYENVLLHAIYAKGYKGLAVDVGAHVGNHTLYLAVVCKLHVVAFEPLYTNELLANVRRNDLKNVRIRGFALGAEEGYAKHVGKGRLEVNGDTSAPIYVTTLDSFNLGNVCLIKVDVEGMEPDVLRGARDTLLRCQPDVYAESPDDDATRAIDEVLVPLGYRVTPANFKTSTAVRLWQPEMKHAA